MSQAIEIRSLCKSYGDFHLGPLELELPWGGILGLVGANGAGKTTLMRLLLGMTKADSGQALVLGAEPQREDMDIREQIGAVLGPPGIPGTMDARLAGRVMAGIYRSWDQARYEQLLRRLELPMDKAYSQFSRGMAMKLGLAIALAHRPRLLLLDEATSGLDPVVRDDVAQLLLDFCRDEDHSVLMSSHIVSDLEKACDMIAFLHRGKLLLVEDKDSLMTGYGLWHCTREQLREAGPGLVLGVQEGPYGCRALVRREDMKDAPLEPVGIEDIFVTMVKGVEA